MKSNCKQIRDQSEYLVKCMLRETEKRISKIRAINEIKIETILRTYIVPPIRGDITKSKLRWRGLKTILYNSEGVLIGLVQRGNVIGEGGTLGIFKNGNYKPY